mgnify:CR=1 FL=1
MQLNQLEDDSLGQYNRNIGKRVKISLFYKAFITKVSSFLTITFILASFPSSANASFLSDFTDLVLGTTATAGETTVIESAGETINNSQTVPLLETSVNPDLYNTNEPEDMVIVQDDSFIYNNAPINPDVKYEKSTLSDKIYVYTIAEGDTLSDIAETFDVSLNTIRWENNISGNNIKVGQKLNILPVTGVKHIVKKGDTISKIADKYEADAEDIYIFNDISKESVLKQGDIIFVPNGIIAPVVVAQSTGSSSSGSSTKTSNTKAPSGYFIRPASGKVTSPYGSRKGGFHYGVDIGNARGTTVSAAADGIVAKVVSGCVEGKTNCGGRYGNYIIIEHSNGMSTMYAHLSAVNVKIGQKVSQGKKIGAIGNTGRSTGPHLHFEVRNANGSTVRPPVN